MAFIKSIKLLFEPIRSLNFSGISGTFAGIGASFDKPIRILVINNNTDAACFFSFDGIDDHLFLPSAGYIIIDVTGNRTNSGDGFFIGEGTRVYARTDEAISTGNVFVSSLYGAP